MNRSRSKNSNNNNNEEDAGWNGWSIAAGVVGGVAALAGGIYWLSRSARAEEPSSYSISRSQTSNFVRSRPQSMNSRSAEREPTNRMSNNNGISTSRVSPNATSSRRGVPRSSVPEEPVVSNIDGLLHDIYVRYISFNDEDFERYYSVVHHIFLQLHNKMKEVDSYYNKYSSAVQYAGSHPDRLRINKPDEFDIDIVIGLPLNIRSNPLSPDESDFIIEPKDPGFVQLKVGVQFERLPYRDGHEWQNNKAAYEWKDEKNYLRRSKFMDWFKSVVNRALNEFVENRSLPPVFYVAGVAYTVRKSESGPAMTIYIENEALNFKLDVDLVPALRFPIDRWPICSSYRNIPPVCVGKDYWMVVPKPNKGALTAQDRARSWRLALHEQEGRLMHNNNHMKQAIRYIKKLRDAQKMNEIASYYIKTIFFWEAMKHQGDREFWNQRPSVLFKVMLGEFHQCLVKGNIPYFWNKNNNLIENVSRITLNTYAAIVKNVIDILEMPWNYKLVARYLLTDTEYKDYERILYASEY